MRALLAAGLAACAIGCVAATAHAAPRHVAKAAPASLEGKWFVNFLLPMEATPKTPNLVVPEAEARLIAASMGKDLSDKFATVFLDPELPQLVAHMDGLPIVRGQRRTRAVVQPADGMLPYTPAARKEASAPPPDSPLNNPEDRPNAERCLTLSAQPPLSSFTFDFEIQILVLRDQVVILSEYGDDLRVIPLTDRHGPAALAGRNGDSIGRWEGRTLVIETVGLPDVDRDRFPPPLVVPGDAKVIERLTPISGKELLYQFTVVDAKTYAAPWLGEFSWFRTDKAIYESACHEGNYALPNILAGARHEELVARTAGGAGGAKGGTP